MKTIFIPIFVPSVARNILRTDVWKKLRQKQDLRVVLFAPSYKKDFYRKEVGAENVFFEPLDNFNDPLNKLDSFFRHLALFFVDNETIKCLRRMRLEKENNYIFYFFSWLLIKLFSNLSFLRRTARLLDYFLVRDTKLAKYFEQYKPDLVFAPHIIHACDQAFIREAKRRKIKTVGLIHSWDNLTANKSAMRINPDVLIVPNEITKREAEKLCDYPGNRIIIAGMPHFDYYFTEKPCAREAFFKRIGGDPAKRLILFAAIGKSFSDTEWQDVQIISDAIDRGDLPSDLQILVRMHPNPAAHMIDRGLKKSKTILFDVPGIQLPAPGGVSEEMLFDDMMHLYNTLFYSDIVVTIQSTMSIDASAFDKPVINVCFDGWEKKPFYDSTSVLQLHHYTHYQPILKSGGVRLAKTAEDLIASINLYLKHPELDREGRARVVKEQCWKFDGGAGKRIADAILKSLDTTI
ncbi:MAG: hypothetical protein A2745_00270 [Candidatus Harrisonbacteria bacterium RIFCSPHIGHO2_01_FULL_44_13]|uniref:UDP-N-acetylglucosamine 2-epimerase domain-containing protein n=1 Tax=Candidatus Harrisonbacteria bacterium RIFCSPLOWO2_01_FULL_44_18 TaxID=1798407 RepID=A0A1G1ZLE8_9BACT|nr:MAG: hypothetical protein A2745_00270 [Candidatus Harrisonbacteria bacterium RIFCSPHIGHO2_01_FULL_44_13]OGY65345.1 MAG: hypothetical protein A3A16_02765 [Candidatus Harrisonbacteria bacterium RIFCSPLOWO2_01_FULL_44_18]